jgi:hypothetical protein
MVQAADVDHAVAAARLLVTRIRRYGGRDSANGLRKGCVLTLAPTSGLFTDANFKSGHSSVGRRRA